MNLTLELHYCLEREVDFSYASQPGNFGGGAFGLLWLAIQWIAPSTLETCDIPVDNRYIKALPPQTLRQPVFKGARGNFLHLGFLHYITTVNYSSLILPDMKVAAIFTILLSAVLVKNGFSAPRCNKSSSPPTNCKYGTVLDWCRNEVCAKGPREACSGNWWENDRCTHGTYCACGFCSGCSATLECWFC